MKAMVLEAAKKPLVLRDLPIPTPSKGQVRIKVLACALCRTDLHILDGELTSPNLPLILGHQVVGLIDTESHRFPKGTLVGVPWLGKSCGHCFFCQRNEENLCDTPTFTGYDVNGGFAEYCVAEEDFIFPIPEGYSPKQAAPLLCAGLIGYRSWNMVGDAQHLGFYGFGNAAHLLIQIAKEKGQTVYVFTKPGDVTKQTQAKEMGATWAGGSDETPPHQLDAAILFAPLGALYPQALKAVRKGGRVISAGIHMSPIPSFDYELLWGERTMGSVANLTRKDGTDFFALCEKHPIKASIQTYRLEDLNQAIEDQRTGASDATCVITLS